MNVGTDPDHTKNIALPQFFLSKGLISFTVDWFIQAVFLFITSEQSAAKTILLMP